MNAFLDIKDEVLKAIEGKMCIRDSHYMNKLVFI